MPIRNFLHFLTPLLVVSTLSLFIKTAYSAYEPWFLVEQGDVYSACESCSYGIKVSLPPISPYQGVEAPYLINGRIDSTLSSGLAISKSPISVKNTDNEIKISSGRSSTFVNYNIEQYGGETYTPGIGWPKTLTFEPTEGIGEDVPADECQNFFKTPATYKTGSIYKMDSRCFAAALGTDGGTPQKYNFGGTDTLILYITDTSSTNNEIVFIRSLIADTNTADRLVIIVNGSVRFDYKVGDPVISTSSVSHIDATIIAKNGILFPSGGSDDKTIIIKGSLFSKGDRSSIQLQRDKGAGNSLPSEIVRFNPKELLDLEELDSAYDSGLTTTSVNWTIE